MALEKRGKLREFFSPTLCPPCYTARSYKHWPTFLPPMVWVYLHSNFCGGLRKMHLFCSRVCIGHSGSSKVVDLGTNRKAICDFLLVINSNFGPILHCFWDTASYCLKICHFSYPHPRSGWTLSNFWMKLTAQKLEDGATVWWKFMILTSAVFDWSTRVTDGQTDG